MWLKLPDFELVCSFVVFFSLLLRFFPQNLRKLWKITNNWFVFFSSPEISAIYSNRRRCRSWTTQKRISGIFAVVAFPTRWTFDSAAIIRYYLITSNIMNISNVVKTKQKHIIFSLTFCGIHTTSSRLLKMLQQLLRKLWSIIWLILKI